MIVVNRLMSDLLLGAHPLLISSVRIPIPERKIAAREVYSDPMPRKEHIARWLEFDGLFVDPSGHEKFGRVLTLTRKTWRE